MHILVFCTEDIPASILNTFLKCLEESVDEMFGKWDNKRCCTPDTPAKYIAFVTTLDVQAITFDAVAPVQAFASPVLGWSLEQLRDWFKANITTQHRKGFSHFTFIVLDSQSVQDETCLLVEVHDESIINSVRTDFYVPLEESIDIEMGSEWMDGPVIGSFMRSGVVMTKENRELAMNGGLYIERGYEVKLDQAWRDFLKW